MSVLPFPQQRLTRQNIDRAIEQEVKSRPNDVLWNRGIQGVLPNRDPVLTILAPATGQVQYRDERIYQAMPKVVPKIADARRHLSSEIFSHDFEIVAGRSGDNEAKMLAEYAQHVWTRLPHRRTVLRLLEDAWFFGWRPMQVIVDKDATIGGRSGLWAPARIVNKPWHMVRFTERGTLVWLPEFSSEAIEYSDTARALGWLTPTCGDIDHEYGDGLYSRLWMLYYVRKQFEQRFQLTVDRQMGSLKVKNETNGGAAVSDAIDEIKEDLQQIIRYYNAHNVLVEVAGWTLEMVSHAQDIVGPSLAVHRYYDEQIQTLVCGEVLTSNPGDRGTQALGTVQRDVKTDYALECSLESIEEPFSEMLARFIAANFGQVNPESLPRLVNRLRLRPSADVVQRLFDMGAKIRGRRLAELYGADGLIAGDDEDPSEVILEKQRAPFGESNPFLRALRPGDPPPEDPDDDEEPDEMEEAKLIKRARNRFSRAADDALRTARPAIAERAHQLALRFASENGLDTDPS